MVRKIEAGVPSKPAYLDEVLKLYPRGAPCQSSLFTDKATVETVRNEVEVDACVLECGGDGTSRNNRLHFLKVLGHSNIKIGQVWKD